MKEQEQQLQYDVYFRGTKQQLFAFLYPLTGPSHPLFQHFTQTRMLYDVNNKSLEIKYQPKDFQNIDKQKEEIIYKSTLLPIQSNYFYSVYDPDRNYFVWQSISNIMEMRPKSKGVGQPKKEEMAEGPIELQPIEFQHPENKIREIIDEVNITPLERNWEISKEEYLIHLAK